MTKSSDIVAGEAAAVVLTDTQVDSSKSSPARFTHEETYDARCVVCTHPDRNELEARYLQWYPITEILELGNLEPTPFKKHIKALELDIIRSKNTDLIIAMGMEKAIERGVLDSLDGDQLIKLLQERNRMDGRITINHKDEGPRQIVMVSFPDPGGKFSVSAPATILPSKAPQVLLDAPDYPEEEKNEP